MSTRKAILGIQRPNLDCSRKAWALLAVVTVAEGLFNLICCGFLVADWRGRLLFSAWMDRQVDKYRSRN